MTQKKVWGGEAALFLRFLENRSQRTCSKPTEPNGQLGMSNCVFYGDLRKKCSPAPLAPSASVNTGFQAPGKPQGHLEPAVSSVRRPSLSLSVTFCFVCFAHAIHPGVPVSRAVLPAFTGLVVTR